MRQLPTWVNVLLAVTAVLAIGLAFYLQQTGPLKVALWFDHMVDMLAGSKALAKIAKAALLIAGGAVALWAGIRAVGKWLRPSDERR